MVLGGFRSFHVLVTTLYLYMLLVKFAFRLNFFYAGLILNFVCLLALIIHELGLENNGN